MTDLSLILEEDWKREVGWLYCNHMDAFESVAPDGERETCSARVIFEAEKHGIYLVPRWFYDTYAMGVPHHY